MPGPEDDPHPWPVFFVGLIILALALLGLLTPFGDKTTTGGFPVRAMSVVMLLFVAYLWFKVARVLVRRRK